MGLLSGIRPNALSSVAEKLLREYFGGGSTASGVSVSSDTAMKLSAVYSCVNILSRVIGMLPCHLMQLKGEMREKASDHSLYPILHDMPNEWMTAPEFWGMAINHLNLRGNFFAIKNRGLNKLTGKVRELIPLAPGIVQEVEQLPNYSLEYKCVFPDGSLKNIPGSEIMHLRGMVSDGYMGVNPIEYVRESIGLGLATQEFGARHFGSGTHPSMIIEYPTALKDPKSMREAISEVYSGLGKSHRIMLLESGMTATNVSINPEDSQFLETRDFQRKEIVDIFFATPLTLMGNSDANPTFASAEQFSISFVIYALMPWIVGIEKSIYRDLLTPDERKTLYAKFRAEGLLRGSFAEQMDGFATAIDKEILNPNECRELLDYNPYKGGEVYRTRTSTTKDTAGNTAGGKNE